MRRAVIEALDHQKRQRALNLVAEINADLDRLIFLQNLQNHIAEGKRNKENELNELTGHIVHTHEGQV